MDKFDVVIIGNGILGLTLAYFLKKKEPNISVALVGSHQRIGCATLAAGAMLNLWCELTEGQSLIYEIHRTFFSAGIQLRGNGFRPTSADYQHGGVQAPYMVDRYNEMRRKEIESFYDKRSINDFGIHPELIHLYENDKFYEEINHKRSHEQPQVDYSGKLLDLLNRQNSLVP